MRPGLAGLGYAVHCPALLGHGAERRAAYPLHAFRDEVLAELDRRGLAEVVLVGHSLGAVIASMVAMAAPARVSHLVLEEMPVLRRTAEDTPPSRRRGITLAVHLMGRRQREYDRKVTREVISALRAPHPDWWSRLPAVTARTLVLTGGATSHLDQSRYALLPWANAATIEVGHRIHTKAPDRWLTAVAEFLAG